MTHITIHTPPDHHHHFDTSPKPPSGQIVVRNILGKIVARFPTEDKFMEVDLTKMPKGPYFIEVDPYEKETYAYLLEKVFVE